jgi:hypothetical protein
MRLRSKKNSIDFEEGTDRGLIVIVFGVRELPRPKGHGYLYFKLDPYGREFFVDYLNLYKTSKEELKELFVLAVQKVRAALAAKGHTKEILTTDCQTENMSDWAVQLLKEVIETGS